uniref:POT1PC domain-containing protein n=2 Tax=Macrostomum lignano TaxID=282301 RepID=A0A1I8GCJ8_9PLAT
MALTASAIRQYTYSRLADITVERNCLNVIAVVSDIVRPQRLSRGSHRDALILVALADESCDRLLTTVFASSPDKLPKFVPGCIVIGHRLKSEVFNGEMRLAVVPRIGGTLYVLPASSDTETGNNLDEDSDEQLAKSIMSDRRQFPQTAGITDVDLARVRELRRWFRNYQAAPSGQRPQSAASSSGASSSSSCPRIQLSELSKLRLQSGGSRKFVDLVAQIVGIGRLDDTCTVARVWDGSEVSAETFRPDPAVTNIEIATWPELPADWLADRYSVDIFVYDEHQEPLLTSVQLGDLVEFGNLSVKLFRTSDSSNNGLGNWREHLLLTLNGGGRNYNRRLCKLDPTFCSLAAKTHKQLMFVRSSWLPKKPQPPTSEAGGAAAIDAATTTVATTTALVTKADERFDDVERIGLAELINSASQSDAGRKVVRATLIRLLPTTADRLVWLLCPNCPDRAWGPEEFSLDDSEHFDNSQHPPNVDLDADNRRQCRRCRRNGSDGESRLSASLCLCLHLTDPEAELLAFVWDAEVLRLLAGCYDNQEDYNSSNINAERLGQDADLRRRVFGRLRDRLPTGARVELSLLHYRAANGTLVFSVCDTSLLPESAVAACTAADQSTYSSVDEDD